jgi:hypothetical protein
MTCEQIIENYLATLRSQFQCMPANKGRVRIVTPYLYPDHDLIEVFVRQLASGELAVSDLGETLRHLESVGVATLSNKKRAFQITKILDGLSVEMRDGVIFRKVGPDDVGPAMLDVIAACKAIGDLVYGTRAYEPATFDTEVADYLRDSAVDVEVDVPVVGASGSTYRIPIRAYIDDNEALIATISPRTKGAIRPQINSVFRMWSDIDHGAWKFAVLNDTELEMPKSELVLLERVCKVERWGRPDLLLSDLKNGPRAA